MLFCQIDQIEMLISVILQTKGNSSDFTHQSLSPDLGKYYCVCGAGAGKLV